MLENILQKLYNAKQTPDIVLLRQKVESVAHKLEYLKSIEPKTKEDFEDPLLILEYVRFTTELNIEIAEMYIMDVFEERF